MKYIIISLLYFFKEKPVSKDKYLCMKMRLVYNQLLTRMQGKQGEEAMGVVFYPQETQNSGVCY